jgi:Arc/MetJ family transcription regulator
VRGTERSIFAERGRFKSNGYHRGEIVAVTTKLIRVDARLADEAKKIYGVCSRAEAVRLAVREFVGAQRSKDLMKKNEAKLPFAGCRE